MTQTEHIKLHLKVFEFRNPFIQQVLNVFLTSLNSCLRLHMIGITRIGLERPLIVTSSSVRKLQFNRPNRTYIIDHNRSLRFLWIIRGHSTPLQL